MTARPIRRNAQTPDRNGKIFYTSTTSLSHISKVCAGVAIIHKELAIRKTVFLGILPQNGALGLDAHAFAADFIIAAQSAI